MYLLCYRYSRDRLSMWVGCLRIQILFSSLLAEQRVLLIACTCNLWQAHLIPYFRNTKTFQTIVSRVFDLMLVRSYSHWLTTWFTPIVNLKEYGDNLLETTKRPVRGQESIKDCRALSRNWSQSNRNQTSQIVTSRESKSGSSNKTNCVQEQNRERLRIQVRILLT